MVRVSKSPEERIFEIMGASKELFATKGYEKTSINDIVKKVGVAKGTFYYYFKSKEELLDRMIEMMWDHIVSGMKEVVKRDDIDEVQKLREFFMTAANYKMREKNITKELTNFLLNKGNSYMMKAMMQKAMEYLVPIFGEIVLDGAKKGIFDVKEDEVTITVQSLLNMFYYMPDFEELKNNLNDLESLKKIQEVKFGIMEKTLGVPKGSINIDFDGFIKEWEKE